MRAVGITLLLALAATTLRAEVERLDEVPAINLGNLVWFVPTGTATGHWFEGDLDSDHPAAMGNIERKPVVGPQRIRWKKRVHDLTFIGRRDDGALIIQFPGNLLVLSPWREDRDGTIWEGTWTVEGAIGSPMRFRTSSKGMVPGDFGPRPRR